MEYNHRMVPPRIAAARRRITESPSLRRFDDDWDEIETTRRPPRTMSLFPPARSDAEIEAFVDECTAELCRSAY
jgi:hypothetical protein